MNCASFFSHAQEAPAPLPQPSQQTVPDMGSNPFADMNVGGIDNDLFLYYSGLTDEELGMEMNSVLMSLAQDPDVAKTISIISQSGGDMMAIASNPEALPGLEKMRASPAFNAISAVIARRQH